jgi:hypothetical protein
VGERAEVEVGAELAVEAREQVAVELGRDARRVVVRRAQSDSVCARTAS